LYYAVWALLFTIIRTQFFGRRGEGRERRRDEEREREWRRLEVQLDHKMKIIEGKLRFVQFSLQSPHRNVIDYSSPAAVLLFSSAAVAADPDTLRMRALIELFSECNNEIRGVTNDLEGLVGRPSCERLCQRVQHSAETIERLIMRFREVMKEVMNVPSPSKTLTPSERHRRKSTSN
ncbi:hypothetical protein PMAYCL1PPCAC_06360, partial [Pristionchus mayeri]